MCAYHHFELRHQLLIITTLIGRRKKSDNYRGEIIRTFHSCAKLQPDFEISLHFPEPRSFSGIMPGVIEKKLNFREVKMIRHYGEKIPSLFGFEHLFCKKTKNIYTIVQLFFNLLGSHFQLFYRSPCQ